MNFVGPAWAESWPAKTVRLVVPFAPGGATDVVARLVADKLKARLGQPVVVENKPGAGGNIGATLVRSSAPDGYTMFVAGSPGFPNAASLTKNPGFDPVKDFVPVAVLSTQPMLLALHPSMPPNTISELVAYAKARPGKLNYATPGIGTPHHLAMELLKTTTGMDIVHVPYRGGGPMTLDVVAGGVPMMFGSYVIVGPHLKTGKLKVLGTTGTEPLIQDPRIKPIADQGYPGFNVVAWFGIVAPAATPAAIVERMAKEVQVVVGDKETRKNMEKIGLDPPSVVSTEEFGNWIKRDVKRWGDVARKAGIKPR
ncbi:MAG: Bug family tripartite tricarboxylate transporter substrate binding protein [Hyphomicrobiaceae bacterium]